jgi:hypothetical protein
LSNAIQNVRADLVSNGGLSGLDLAQFGVTTGPSTSPADVSGVVASGGVDGPLGSGSATLAVDSKSGSCWFVWISASTTWFGVQPDATSCVARNRWSTRRCRVRLRRGRPAGSKAPLR